MSSPLDRAKAAAQRLKIFPLPSAVLFPGAVMPLHIFEARYRALIHDALETDQLFALGGLQPGWEANYQGRPGLAPLCCIGSIAWHEELEDGRYNLLVQGLCRARVVTEQPPSKSYREVSVELVEDPPYDGQEVELVRQAVLELASNLPQAVAQQLVLHVSRCSGGQLADVVAAAIVDDAARRQQLLETASPRDRLSLVLADVSELIARTHRNRPTGPLN